MTVYELIKALAEHDAGDEVAFHFEDEVNVDVDTPNREDSCNVDISLDLDLKFYEIDEQSHVYYASGRKNVDRKVVIELVQE